MLTAMLTVENLYGESFDTWDLNVEAEYHEQRGGTKPGGSASQDSETPG